MLSKEDNELLCRVGSGTPMGDLMRHYWQPILLTSELPDPDGPPKRVRLLGEDLIAFRDTTGRVGLLGNHCPHRGASLFFARNEEHGLRCVYHGWKYDVTGRCVDIPNEPSNSWTYSGASNSWTYSGGRDSIESSTLGAQAEPAERWTYSGGRDSGDSAGLEAQAAGLASQPRRRRQDRPAQWQRLLAARERIQHLAYPCRERGGLIWAYLGALDPPPDLPALEFSLVPDDHRYLSKRLQPTNFAQALEGEIDQSHVSFLHSSLKVDDDGSSLARVARIRAADRHPRFEAVNTDCGVLIGARRSTGEDRYYWRITQFLMPFWTMTGPYGENPSRSTRAWVPMDDESTMVYIVSYHPMRPLAEQEIARYRGGTGLHVNVDRFQPATSEPGGAWKPKAQIENDFFLDHELQHTEKFCGIPEFWAQDAGCQVSMGAIYDRTQEHLGTADTAIIRVRQRWIESAEALRDRAIPPTGSLEPELYRVRAAALMLPGDASWLEGSAEHRVANPEVNYAGV